MTETQPYPDVGFIHCRLGFAVAELTQLFLTHPPPLPLIPFTLKCMEHGEQSLGCVKEIQVTSHSINTTLSEP